MSLATLERSFIAEGELCPFTASVHTQIDDYHIDFSVALSEFAAPGTQAYAAYNENHSQRYIALFCPPEQLPRWSQLKELAALDSCPYLSPLAWGVALCPPRGQEQLVVIIPYCAGGRLAGPGLRKMSEQDILLHLLPKIVHSLSVFRRQNLVHRALRLDNLFLQDPLSLETIVLGESFSSAPGLHQPAIYEPLYRLFSCPQGRGGGTVSDDLYALGVTLVAASLGKTPADHLAEHEIIKGKMASGSYAFLMAHTPNKFTKLSPVLRGILTDDPSARWGLEDLKSWLKDRRIAAGPKNSAVRSSRSFTFAGDKYWSRQSLALALSAHWSEAQKTIDDRRFIEWMELSLRDQNCVRHLQALVRQSRQDSKNVEDADITTSRCLALLNSGQLFSFGALRVTLEGFGTAMAYSRHDLAGSLFQQALQARLPQFWLRNCHEKIANLEVLESAFERWTQVLEIPALAMADKLAYCCYDASENLFCAKLYDAHNILSISPVDALARLEHLAKEDQLTEDTLLDSDLAIFMAARLGYNPSSLELLLGSNPGSDLVLSRLFLFAKGQDILGPRRLPALTSCWYRLLEPLVMEIHCLATRKQLKKRLKEAAKGERLLNLHQVINDWEMRQADSFGFTRAQESWTHAEAEIVFLSAGGMTAPQRVREQGRQAAVLASTVFAGIVIAVTIVSFFR